MLNNKGQSLVIFVICLPLLLLFLTYIFDIVSVKYEKRKITNLANNIIASEKKENMCELALKNDENIICNVNDTKLEIKKRVKSLFGKIINKDYYEIKVSIEI